MAFGKRAWIDLALHTAFCLADIQIVKAGSGPLWPTVSQKSAAGLAGLEGCDFQSDLPSAPCDVGYRRQLACCLGFLDIRTFALRIPCTAGGKIPGETNLTHCPYRQSFVRCGPHHRAELCVLDDDDIRRLHSIWEKYKDDLTWPVHDEKPKFSPEDFDTFYGIAQQVVDAMVEEYKVPMILDQATISNTNHIGHQPHCDNVRFDSVWWKGQRIRGDDELAAARGGAYVLWRSEKTSHRSYSCSVALSDPNGYEGGEIQFFDTWGARDPVATYKCAKGCGIAFCGCQRNIHAVTGVKNGFRLVLLVWTRPPGVPVPDSQAHVCYFRPGTGRGCWLHSLDVHRGLARRAGRQEAWLPQEADDGCLCDDCAEERAKVSWSDCLGASAETSAAKATPSTSAGTSPRTPETPDSSGTEASSVDSGTDLSRHCPYQQPHRWCHPHGRRELPEVLNEDDMRILYQIWQKHQDDLTRPWYRKKPTYSEQEFEDFSRIAQKVVDAMAVQFGQPLVLDQASVNSTNQKGHPPHADNVQFDSVWWQGQQLKQRDEVEAVRGGAPVLWKASKTAYRNYSASIALTGPEDYGGGSLEFFDTWGAPTPAASMRSKAGSGVAFCGCQHSIHAVTGVRWGFRLVLVVWTRHPNAHIPEDQMHVCYFRPGSGLSIWLTAADLRSYPKRRRKEALCGQEESGDQKSPETAAKPTEEAEVAGSSKYSGGWSCAN
ncbi:unnamed protein product [Symbiodinium natans]|uniref:Fe2OG dioxygenase domain-containing protein n=1 Tax=Symbiodinium natans TaxID=878477 RepID=A0A812UEL4_9DINO|nr:unnamed protein product [Symbiodinium natans]